MALTVTLTVTLTFYDKDLNKDTVFDMCDLPNGLSYLNVVSLVNLMSSLRCPFPFNETAKNSQQKDCNKYSEKILCLQVLPERITDTRSV